MSVTVIVNHWFPSASGGAGSRLQSTPGLVSTGPVVVCLNLPATEYDQSQATIVPGAVDVLPLKVQLSVLPLLASVQVSVMVGPSTPKFAVATVGRVTESCADALAPPYVPLMVLTIVPPTALVAIVNGAFTDPAGTVTLAGTVAASVLDSDTTAPPAGAAPVKATVPVTRFPPTTLGALSAIDAIATELVTVSVGDCRLPPLTVAVIVAVPGASAVTMNVALEEPAAIVTGVCTFATEGLLLDSETVAPVGGADAVRLTVPSSRVPAATLVALNAMADTPNNVLVGLVDEPEPPQSNNAIVAAIVVASVTNGEWLCFWSVMTALRHQQRCHSARR